MKKSNKTIIVFLSVILINISILEQTVLADSIGPTESFKQPGMLIFFGVCIAAICAFSIYYIITAKKNK